MPRKDISSLSQRALALTILSKLLYNTAIGDSGMEELVSYHKNLLQYYMNKDAVQADDADLPAFSVHDIPWENILDAIASKSDFLNQLTNKQCFSAHEVRYMCAMMCGLSGKEYGLITGFKSHYNLSWSIRHKFGVPAKSTNLRIYLQKLSDCPSYESLPFPIPKKNLL